MNPSLSLSDLDDKAYLAYTVTDAGGFDVLVDYYDDGSWQPAQGPAQPDARRRRRNRRRTSRGGRQPATVSARSSGGGGAPLSAARLGNLAEHRDRAARPGHRRRGQRGLRRGRRDRIRRGFVLPRLAFDETVQSAPSQTQTRVLLVGTTAETVGTAAIVDGIGNSGADAGEPALALNEYGRGWVTSADLQSRRPDRRSDRDQRRARVAGTAARPRRARCAPDAAPGVAGLTSTLIAWQQSTVTGPAIAVSYASDGVDLGPAQIVSGPAQGPTAAADGLASGGDSSGDGAVAWVQGNDGALSIVATQLFAAPSAPAPDLLNDGQSHGRADPLLGKCP